MLLLWFVDGSQTHALPPVLDPTKSRVDQPVPEAPTPIVVGRSKRLFVNDWVVEQMDGMVRTMHAVSKHPDNPLFRPEESWEGHNVLLFGTVMYDPHPGALLDFQLAVSPDGKHWGRAFDEAWIPLSPLPADYVRVKLPHTPPTGVDPFDERVPWDYGNNSASSMGPVRVGDELWMCYSGRRTDHASSPHVGAIGLGTLRLDGFVSLDAAEEEGVVLTRPLRLLHGSLHVNADASEGSLQVEILDDQGIPLPPFTRDNCEPICTDDVRHLVRWRGAKVMDFEELNGREIRLRFHLQNAGLYSFWTGEEMSWSTPDTTTWKLGE